jgi:hypothetical protein
MMDHSIRPPVKNRSHLQIALDLAKRLLDLEQALVVFQRLLAITFLHALIGVQQEPAIYRPLLLDAVLLAGPF